jgi:hypothetical protein
MSIMKITEQQAQALLNARKLSTYARSAEKKRIIAEVKRQHGIPSGTKIVLFIENPNNPLFRVIRDKRTRMPLNNGVPDTVKPVVQAKSPAAKAPVKVAAKVMAKKTPAKKVAAKAPVKVAAKAPVKVAAKKAAPAAGYPKSVRISFNGSRVRLGTAKDAAHEKRLIAAYKRANS